MLDAAINNSKCQSCHDQAAPNTAGGGSDKKVERHFSDTYTDPTTGVILDAACVECHNVMYLQTNLKFVRSTIRSRTVVFTAYTGTNSYADGDSTYDGICEVCHTQTLQHRNDNSTIRDKLQRFLLTISRMTNAMGAYPTTTNPPTRTLVSNPANPPNAIADTMLPLRLFRVLPSPKAREVNREPTQQVAANSAAKGMSFGLKNE